MATQLPDLVIEDIFLNEQRQISVRVKNVGRGLVPDEVWGPTHPLSSGVFLYIDGRGWGGRAIRSFDPSKNLQQPGGTAIHICNFKPTQPVTPVAAVVDRTQQITEANESNNVLSIQLEK
jgi:hypothetical protein